VDSGHYSSINHGSMPRTIVLDNKIYGYESDGKDVLHSFMIESIKIIFDNCSLEDKKLLKPH